MSGTHQNTIQSTLDPQNLTQSTLDTPKLNIIY